MQSQGLQRAELATQTRGLRPGFARTCNADTKIATQTQDLRRRCRTCGAKPRLATHSQDLQRKATSCGAGLQLRAIFCNTKQGLATQMQVLRAQSDILQRKARICNEDAGFATRCPVAFKCWAVQVFPTHRTSWAATLIVSVGNRQRSAKQQQRRVTPSSSSAEQQCRAAAPSRSSAE